MIARLPVTTWDRFSFVETCTVSSTLRNAASTTFVSGVAETKLPPIAMKTRASPSRIARIASTVSWPCSRGAVKPNSRSSAARKCSDGFS